MGGNAREDAASGSTASYRSFGAFCPFYLSQHGNRRCRRLHLFGTTLALAAVIVALVTRNLWWLAAGIAVGYAAGWVGHFFFEKNTPATFSHPFYSFAGDWAMWRDTLSGRIKF
jgi:hypothetical protein